jgi:hypothetical protein
MATAHMDIIIGYEEQSLQHLLTIQNHQPLRRELD